MKRNVTACCGQSKRVMLCMQAAKEVYPVAIDHAKLKAVFEQALPPLTDSKSLAARYSIPISQEHCMKILICPHRGTFTL